MSENVEGFRKASEHTSAVSTTVLSAADDLAAQAGEPRRVLGEFLVTLRGSLAPGQSGDSCSWRRLASIPSPLSHLE